MPIRKKEKKKKRRYDDDDDYGNDQDDGEAAAVKPAEEVKETLVGVAVEAENEGKVAPMPRKSRRPIYEDDGVVTARKRIAAADDEEEEEEEEEYQAEICVAGGWVVMTASLVTCVAPTCYFFFASTPGMIMPPFLIFIGVVGILGCLFGLSYTQPGVYIRCQKTGSNFSKCAGVIYNGGEIG